MNQNDKKIEPQYSFGSHLIIFCYDNTLRDVAKITWPYKGVLQNSHLPVFLKTKASIEGKDADPNGVITIENTEKEKLIVSCEFGF